MNKCLLSSQSEFLTEHEKTAADKKNQTTYGTYRISKTNIVDKEYKASNRKQDPSN